MPTVNEILTQKSADVVSIDKDASVFDAAQLMNKHKIGALVVIEQGQLQGIFTERDVLRRVVTEKRDPATTHVQEVMTPGTEVACCRTDTTIEEARTVMKNRRIRHLPVVGDERKLLGMISIGDLNAYRANTQEVTIHFLHEYLYGRT